MIIFYHNGAIIVELSNSNAINVADIGDKSIASILVSVANELNNQQ